MSAFRGPMGLGFLFGAAAIVVIAAVIWLALPRATTPSQVSTRSVEVARGEQLYNANCASCHGGPTGGGMMDYPPKHNANGHTFQHPDCELAQIVWNGGDAMTEAMRQMMAPPDAPTMPAWREKLSTEEIDAVLAYIKTMWTPNERDAQARITKEACG